MTEQLSEGFFFGGYLPETLPDDLRASASPVTAEPVGSDRHFMHLAMIAAMRQVGLSAPNPTVGCVIVKDGHVVAEGATEAYGGRHAERVALDQARERGIGLEGATAYVTLEPCCHTGKQPPCVDGLIASGIKRCVVALVDPHRLVRGQGLERLRAAGVEVEVGVFATEAAAWHYPFFLSSLSERPVVVAKWAQTMDGHLADDEWRSQWISGPAARAYTHWLREKYDAIMVGAGTVLADFPSLNVRSPARPNARQPLRIIWDPSGRLLTVDEASQAKLIAKTFSRDQKTVYVVGVRIWQERGTSWLAELARGSSELMILPVSTREEAWHDFMVGVKGEELTAFWGKPLQSILVEGGAKVFEYLLERNAIDLFHTFVTPGFLGGAHNRVGRHAATPTESGPRSTRTSDMVRYELMAVGRLGADCVMEYIPRDRFELIWR